VAKLSLKNTHTLCIPAGNEEKQTEKANKSVAVFTFFRQIDLPSGYSILALLINEYSGNGIVQKIQNYALNLQDIAFTFEL